MAIGDKIIGQFTGVCNLGGFAVPYFCPKFEAISGFDSQEKQIIREVLEGLILKHEAKRWATTS